jgi:putative aldouronate transport system substrate-binding protein
MKKILMLVLLAAFTAGMVFAAGEKEASGTAPGNAKPTTLVWYMFFDDQDDLDQVWSEVNDHLRETINVEIDYRPMNYTTYSQKVPILFASGEIFDMLWMCDWIAGSTYAKFAQDEVLLPLDDLLDDYGKDVKDSLPGKIWDLTKIDGNIYGVPNTQNFTRWRGMWVKKDLADKYGFDPDKFKTYKDLEPFYQKVLANEPGVVPFNHTSGTLSHMKDGIGPAPAQVPMKQLSSGFNAYSDDPRNFYHELIDDKYRDSILANWNAMHDWYEKGYIRSDALTVKDTRAEVKAGKIASSICTLNFNSEANFKNENGYEAYFFPVATPELSGVTATLNTISITSKNPEKAMEFLNQVHTDKYLYNLMVFGIEGEHYNKIGENRVEQIADSGYNAMSRHWTLGSTFLRYLIPGEPEDLHERVSELNTTANPSFMPDWSFDDNLVKNEVAAIQALWDEIGKGLGLGVLDPDEYVDTYIEKIKKAGIEKIRAEMEVQFQKYWDQKE